MEGSELKKLTLFTSLPELWIIFNDVITLSPLDSNGFFTLTMMDTYLNHNDIELSCTYKDFWMAMKEFLSRTNHKVYLKRKDK